MGFFWLTWTFVNFGMEFIRGIHNLHSGHRGCVASIGNYDGVHVGHQAIVRQVIEKANDMQLPSLIVLFEPQPLEYFARRQAPARLMRLRDKVLRLDELGVDRVLCLQFTSWLRKLNAEDFVHHVLVKGIGAKHLVIGDDFRFGHDRSGNFQYLKQAGVKEGFAVEDTATVEINGLRVSSTRVRQALGASKFDEVSQLLGTDYSIQGRVIQGKQLGRTIGVPTANINLHRKKSPLAGTYLVDFECENGQVVNGLANIGTRPTVNGVGELLEVHLLDFNEDLYGHKVSVTFLSKLREEQKFPDLDSLKAQIGEDIKQARDYFLNRRE